MWSACFMLEENGVTTATYTAARNRSARDRGKGEAFGLRCTSFVRSWYSTLFRLRFGLSVHTVGRPFIGNNNKIFAWLMKRVPFCFHIPNYIYTIILMQNCWNGLCSVTRTRSRSSAMHAGARARNSIVSQKNTFVWCVCGTCSFHSVAHIFLSSKQWLSHVPSCILSSTANNNVSGNSDNNVMPPMLLDTCIETRRKNVSAKLATTLKRSSAFGTAIWRAHTHTCARHTTLRVVSEQRRSATNAGDIENGVEIVSSHSLPSTGSITHKWVDQN